MGWELSKAADFVELLGKKPDADVAVFVGDDGQGSREW